MTRDAQPPWRSVELSQRTVAAWKTWRLHNMRRKLKPTIKATSEPRRQRDDLEQEPRNHSNTTNEQPTSSHHSFTPHIHSTYSQHVFTAPIHSTHSHRMFTLARPTMIVRLRPPGGTMVRPPGGGRNPRSVVGITNGPESPTGLRANGPADQRVCGRPPSLRSGSRVAEHDA